MCKLYYGVSIAKELKKRGLNRKQRKKWYKDNLQKYIEIKGGRK